MATGQTHPPRSPPMPCFAPRRCTTSPIRMFMFLRGACFGASRKDQDWSRPVCNERFDAVAAGKKSRIYRALACRRQVAGRLGYGHQEKTQIGRSRWACRSTRSVLSSSIPRTSPDARRPSAGRSGQGLADPGDAGGGRGPAGFARDAAGQAVAQRRGRGPHAHRPYVDAAQGAGRRLAGRRHRDGAAGRLSPGRAGARPVEGRSAGKLRAAADGRGRRRLPCGPSRRATWPKPTPISGSASPTR